MSGDIKKGNVFFIEGGLPKIYSSFQNTEEILLTEIRALDVCGFFFTIVCEQIDTNAVRKTQYHGDIKVKNGFKYITIIRDEHNSNGCKKLHREKIRINLDY